MSAGLEKLLAVCQQRTVDVTIFVLTWCAMATGTVAAEMSRIEIELNNTPAPDDDYLCWTPTPARIRIAGATESVSVVLTNRSDDGGGEVVFQTLNGQRPTSADFAPKPTMIVTLSEKGSWSHFWVAGTRPSTEDKDTSIVVTRVDDGVELTAIPLMVRVRKDASTLTPEEISRFLSALGSHHAVGDERIESRYMKYTEAHQMAFNYGIHFYDQDLHKLQLEPYPPLFLAWHRAFLLSLERELQSLDPTVSIPYWRFDRDDTDGKIFSVGFMGTVEGGDRLEKGNAVMFSDRNPLNGWRSLGDSPLVRNIDGTTALVPPKRLQLLLEARDSSGDLIHNSYIEISEQLEYAYHNGVHTGINGVLFSEASPADPLFFLLHANVDRAWALWQHSNSIVRFDPAHIDAYPYQGRYPGGLPAGEKPFRKGSYAADPMWPWGGVSGDRANVDPHDNWPEMAFDMPIGPGVGGPSARPTPASMVDYLDTRGTGLGTGACYDALRF